MKRLAGCSLIFICLVGFWVALSIQTPAQTTDSQKRNAEKVARECALATGPERLAQAPAVMPSDGRDLEECRSANAKRNPNPCRSLLARQSSSTLKTADEQAAPAAGQATGASDKGQAKNGELVIALYPILSPALDRGLQGVVGYIFRGKLAGDRGLLLPINVMGKGFGAQTLLYIAKNLYIGPRFQLRQMNVWIDFSALEPCGLPDEGDKLPADIVAEVPDDLLRTRTVAIGPRLQRDTRNDQFYPTRGSVLNGGGYFLKTLGSRFDDQIYQVRLESYCSLSERQVLAFGSIVCAAASDRVPFYDLCLYGVRNYVRGYAAGRFQDRHM